VAVFLGREEESEALIRALGKTRLVTVVGTGGVGKTTLARHILEHGSDHGNPGSFIDLTELSPSGLIEAIAGSLGYGSFDALIDGIGTDDWLLVLDNCEHMLDPSADAVETLLQRCPRLKVICTSREPLEIPDEVILRLGPLSLDGMPSPAGQLFISAALARGYEVAGELEYVE
jgi:predicted ATPase